MAYAIKWLLENRILYVLSTGIGTAEDVVNMNRDVQVWLEQCESRIHLIADGQTERNDISLGDLLTIIRSSPASPKLNWMVYVSQNKMNRFFGGLASQISGANTKSFATLPEAIEFLKRTDLTLPDNIPLPD